MAQTTEATATQPSLAGKFSTWLFSLGCMIAVPCLPLGIEAAKHTGTIKPESYFLTAAVLAATFGLSSESNFFRFGYIMAFLGTISLDFQPEQGEAWLSVDWAAKFMFAVAILHAIERFTWHIVLDRRFPDWLRSA
jgi:hypothetical protein